MCPFAGQPRVLRVRGGERPAGRSRQFTLRVLGGDRLRHLLKRAKEQRYYTVPWPVADYDSCPAWMPWPDDAPGFAMERKWQRRSAARCGQTRSDAVIVALLNALTCNNVIKQRLCRLERSVRIEGVRGSNPLSSTQRSSHFTSVHVHIWL